MANYKNKNGSTVLITVLVTGCILLYYCSAWYSTILMSNLVSTKYIYQKNYRLTESLYFFGLEICLKHFQMILKNKEQNINIVNLYQGPWPLNGGINIGIIKVSIESDSEIKIQAVFKTSANLKQNIITAHITREEIKQKNTKKSYFKFRVKDWSFH